MLAGISVEYYTRLERGNTNGVSDDVLEGIARALQLDEAERAHLFDLVRAAGTSSAPRRRPTQERVRPGVQQILDSITAPAYVRNERLDILAANRLGEALYSPVFDLASRPINVARFLFLSPKASEFFVDWDTIAHDAVAILRAAAGRDPYDKRLTDLIGELSTRSDEFRVRWAAHNVKFHRTGTKRFHHPSSATSPSTSKPSNWRPTPDNASTSTPPNLAHRHTTRSTCSPRGSPHRPKSARAATPEVSAQELGDERGGLDLAIHDRP